MLTSTDISNYIAKAQRSNTSIAKKIRWAGINADNIEGSFFAAEFLSLGVNVLSNPNNGLDNLDTEILIDEMIRIGKLNDFSGDPISFLVNTVIVTGGEQGPIGPQGPPGTGWTWQTGLSGAGYSAPTATQLTANITNVTTVNVGTGVVLLPAAAGLFQMVQNNGANDLKIYPAGGDKFIGTNPLTGLAYVGGAPLILSTQNTVRLWCIATGLWLIW